MAKMQREMEELRLDRDRYKSFAHELEQKQEEMIRMHTIETGELRKKISVLTNHVQSLEGAASNASGFPGSFNDMDGITLDGSWENMPVFGDFSMEQQPAEVKQEMQMVPAKKSNEVALPADSEKPSVQQGGLLFMLFLVGAFVLSSRSTPSIPRVSEDVRAASATLLENVFKDAGVSQVPSGIEAAAPRPSGTNTNWAQPAGSSLPMATPMVENVAPSTLGDMADALTQPTEQQTNEQIFSLSAAQYNDLTSQDFLQDAPAERSTSQGRRNLAEALANMRNSGKQSAAEVYTRSLLWDQIPSDVVRAFAKMVAESNNAAASKGEEKE